MLRCQNYSWSDERKHKIFSLSFICAENLTWSFKTWKFSNAKYSQTTVLVLEEELESVLDSSGKHDLVCWHTLTIHNSLSEYCCVLQLLLGTCNFQCIPVSLLLQVVWCFVFAALVEYEVLIRVNVALCVCVYVCVCLCVCVCVCMFGKDRWMKLPIL